jgi:hypothetical protein
MPRHDGSPTRGERKAQRRAERRASHSISPSPYSPTSLAHRLRKEQSAVRHARYAGRFSREARAPFSEGDKHLIRKHWRDFAVGWDGEESIMPPQSVIDRLEYLSEFDPDNFSEYANPGRYPRRRRR